jgi:hypothetical protein
VARPAFDHGNGDENSSRNRRIGVLAGGDASRYRQFARERAEVLELHAAEWPNRLPTSLAFAEGPPSAAFE